MMAAWRRATLVLGLAVLGGCASMPPPVIITAEEEAEPESVEVPTPLVEYPPIEPVEPPVVIPAAIVPPVLAAAAPVVTEPLAMVPPAWSAAPAASTREPVLEDTELILLLADLQRYSNLSVDDVRREVTSMTVLLGRQRNDGNRVRLAVLYTFSKATPQDDQRALQLLDNVAKSTPGTPAVKPLALVLQAQIAGRQRAVREEQQKADAALQKLEALRQMERSLLRERARSGGGGGGGGASGGGSGGGSGGAGSGGN